MPISEFYEWQEFLLLHSKQDWYAAQIAAECRRAIAEKPKEVKVSDFLLVVSTTAEVQERGNKSKAAWASFLGVDVSKRN